MITMFQIYGRSPARQFDRLAWPGIPAVGGRMRIRLNDGTRMQIRPARPADSDAVLAMHEKVSPASLFFRYLGARRPTRTEIERICRLNRGGGLALVATTAGRHPVVAGLAYLVLETDRLRATAEPAIMVEDAFRGRGLGRRLFGRLCSLARKKKISVLHTYVHGENRRMLRILEGLGYPLVKRCHANMVEAEIVLDSDLSAWLPPELAGFGAAAAECG